MGVPRWFKQSKQTDKPTNTQKKHFFISAITSPVLTTILGNVHVGIPSWSKRKTKNKQTNKQQFLEWQHVSQRQLILYKTFRISFFWYPKQIENKSKQTYKQPNTFYLSQIKSDLYKTFRKYFFGYSKIIQTKKKTNQHKTNK